MTSRRSQTETENKETPASTKILEASVLVSASLLSFAPFFGKKISKEKNPNQTVVFFLLLLQDKVCLMPELIICPPLPLLPQLLLLRRGPRIPRNNG